jgi:hypothetical protein
MPKLLLLFLSAKIILLFLTPEGRKGEKMVSDTVGKYIFEGVSMKNTMRCLGFIAFVVVIGFSMIACDTGMAGGPGGGSRLTVTGLPSDSRNWNVTVYGSGTDISTSSALSRNWDIEASEWSNSSGNVFILTGADLDTSYWTKSGRFPVHLVEKSKSDYEGYWATVNFSNGSATVSWSSFRAIAR